MVEKFIRLRERKEKLFYFRLLKSNYYDGKTSALRYKLYAIFSAWKMYSREKVLLKKYLVESNMDERLAYTPLTDERGGRSQNASKTKAPHLMSSQMSGLSSEFSQTINTNLEVSPDKIEKDLMVSSFKNF